MPRWWGVSWVVLVISVLAWALLWYRFHTIPADYAAGKRLYNGPASGDHMYYSTFMLVANGDSLTHAVREASQHFHYRPGATRMLHGVLSPVVTQNYYPRSLWVLGLILAPLLGANAIYAPGLVAALLLPLALAYAAKRLGALAWLGPPLVLLMLTVKWREAGTGAYTEAMLGLCLVVAVAMLPYDDLPMTPARYGWLVWAAVWGSLARQLGVAFVAIGLGGLLWVVAFGPDRRARLRVWLPPSVVLVLLGSVGQWASGRWGPFHALMYLENSSHKTGLGALMHGVARLPGLYGWHTFSEDPLVLVLLVAAALSALRLYRHPLAGIALAVLAATMVSVVIIGLDMLRYMEPSYPVLVLLIAVALSRTMPFGRATTDAGADTAPEKDSAPGGDLSGGPGRRRPPRWAGVAVPLVLAVALPLADVVVNQPARQLPVGTVSASDYPGRWPFRVASLRLTCGGRDDQLWAVAPDGHRYAVTGTALQHSFGASSLEPLLTGRNALAALKTFAYAMYLRCPTTP